MPAHARTCFDDPVFIGLTGKAQALDFYFQHQRFDVPGQHNIAAAAQHLPGHGGQLGVGQHGAQIFFVPHTHQCQRFGRDTERVVRLKGDVFLQVHGRIVALTTSGFQHHAYF